MRSRRTRARLDFLGNLLVVGLIVLFRRESARIDRLREADALDEDATENANAVDTAGDERTTQQPAVTAEIIDEVDVPNLRVDWFLVGAASGVVYRASYDRDIAGIRRSRSRRWALILAIWHGQAILVLDDRDKSHSFGVGSSVGAVCYRTKYGILSAIPDR